MSAALDAGEQAGSPPSSLSRRAGSRRWWHVAGVWRGADEQRSLLKSGSMCAATVDWLRFTAEACSFVKDWEEAP